jgi:hypothetical protein
MEIISAAIDAVLSNGGRVFCSGVHRSSTGWRWRWWCVRSESSPSLGYRLQNAGPWPKASAICALAWAVSSNHVFRRSEQRDCSRSSVTAFAEILQRERVSTSSPFGRAVPPAPYFLVPSGPAVALKLHPRVAKFFATAQSAGRHHQSPSLCWKPLGMQFAVGASASP